MKKILSVLVCIALLLGSVPAAIAADTDNCIRLTDTSGGVGYSSGSDSINSSVTDSGGVTLIFDVLVESVATPAEGQTAQIAAFTGSDNNLAGYDFTSGRFFAGFDSQWISNSGTFTPYATRDFVWQYDTWYELAIQFTGKDMAVYLDGSLMVYAETDGFAYEYIILYPQYCNALIDNMRVCSGDYNVFDRYGDVWGVDDFNSAASVADSSVWGFSGTGYSLDDCGNVMTTIGEMLPKREVSPTIEGAYLRYRESGGTSIVPAAVDFTPYGGFTYVEDIRFDGAMTGSNFGVRFGGGYIAGYDWTSMSFVIALREGYGFATSEDYVYAATPYTIEKGTVYEMAVRQSGDIVSVYLNGVLMAQAKNANFAKGYDTVEVSHYKCTASVDNVVVAYPDYNVREGEGGSLGTLTFDESVEYICSVWDYKLGTSGYGYSVQNVAGTVSPTVTVSSVEATGTAVTVPVSVKNCPGYTAFTLEVAYDTALSVNTALVSSSLDGTAVLSPLTSNPLVLTYVGEAVSDADIINVIFATPENEGTYTVTATLIPYVGDLSAATVTGSGKVTVPDPGLPMGAPANFRYEDGVFYWDEVEGAMGYELYYFYKGTENYYDEPEECFYEMDFGAEFSKAGEYIFYIYVYDRTWEYVSRSYPLVMIVADDGSIYAGIEEYAAAFAAKLQAFADENEYYTEELREINRLISEAESAMSAAVDSATVELIYESYLASVDAVLTKSERTDFAVCTPEDATGEIGKSVTVPVILTGAADVLEITFDVKYDPTYMTYTECKVLIDEEVFSVDVTDSGSAVTVSVVGEESLVGNVALAELTFTLADTLQAGDTLEITTEVSHAVDSSCYDITVLGGSATVSVTEAVETVIPGDANGDGFVDSSDLQLLLRHMAGLEADMDAVAADYNGDGWIDGSDVMCIKRILAGLSV